MKQRIAMVAMLAVIAASVMACVDMWLLLQQSRDANAAILAELKSLHSQAAQPPVSYDWASAAIECVLDGDESKPAPGMEVKLTGRAIDPADEITLAETTGGDGAVRFKPIRPGRYRLTIKSPGKWGLLRKTEIVVLPGNEHVERVVCPAAEIQEANVTIRLEWPEGEQFDSDATLECLLYPADGGRYVQIDGAWWDAPDRPQVTLNIGPDGSLIAPQEINPYGTDEVPPYRQASALDCPNAISRHEATCTVAAVPYQRGWKILGVKQSHGTAAMYAGSAGGGTIATQRFAIVNERDEGEDAPVLEARSGDGNVWTIEVSKAFAERIKSVAEQMAPPESPYPPVPAN